MSKEKYIFKKCVTSKISKKKIRLKSESKAFLLNKANYRNITNLSMFKDDLNVILEPLVADLTALVEDYSDIINNVCTNLHQVRI